MITSSHNPKVKRAIQLRNARRRKKSGLIIIDGLREIRRAMAGGVTLVEALVSGGELSDAAAALARELASQTEVWEVAPALHARIAFGARDEGIVAIARRPAADIAQWQPPEHCLTVIVEAAEKPGNLGAVVRTADGAGANAVIAANALCDPFHPNAIRASLGLVFCLPIFTLSSEAAIAWLKRHEFAILAAVLQASIDYRSADYSGRVAIALGSEASGLSSTWRTDEITPIRLPMRGWGDSLNLSAAAAALLYHAAGVREGDGARSGQ